MKKSIPSLLTAANLLFGFLAIVIMSTEGNQGVKYAAILIIAGMILDGFDGRIARKLKAESEFGKELDSLADIVTFGVAPALIIYHVSLINFGNVGLAIAASFPIFGAFRLARFNVSSKKSTRFFTGLPITAAGGILATFSLYHLVLEDIFFLITTIALAFLMVSKAKYPNFKKVSFPKHTLLVTTIIFVIVAVIAWRFPEKFSMLIFVPLGGYGLIGIVKLARAVAKKKEGENEEDSIDTK